jgi:phage terminase large subunit-like protein
MLEWCLGNVAGHHDGRGNFYPPEPRPEQKIDSAADLIMVLGRAISGQAPSRMRIDAWRGSWFYEGLLRMSGYVVPILPP